MCKLDEKTVIALKEAGFLKGKYDDFIRIASVYKEELSKNGGKKMEAIYVASDKCNKSIPTVERAVRQTRGII